MTPINPNNPGNPNNPINSIAPNNSSNATNPLNARYVVVTPVRDEALYIGKTIESMVNQTILPKEWIIVDDGSTDQTPKIINEAAKQYPWIKTIHRPNRGFRKSGGGVIEAFYDGYAALSFMDWDFIVKLDGDLSFEPVYFQECFHRFEKDPKLGICGGAVWNWVDGKLINDGQNDPKFHVRGATKIYKRACWEQITPLTKAPGWDTIDEVKANMFGWHTLTFVDLKLIQHKVTGSADGKWRNAFKNGQANYVTGYHPFFMLGKCLRRLLFERSILTSVGLLTGFFSGYLKRLPQVEDRRVIQYLRRQQFLRILGKPNIYG